MTRLTDTLKRSVRARSRPNTIAPVAGPLVSLGRVGRAKALVRVDRAKHNGSEVEANVSSEYRPPGADAWILTTLSRSLRGADYRPNSARGMRPVAPYARGVPDRAPLDIWRYC